ncbi:carboxypeptidase-like regulatory domain-containing protein, partial [Parabacteroides goldsteinii]|uniref:carboxypeptidase-like regulatory domain-containing protein n=1 Tax=Parabacteroides goldsteinii TaxID=328812 RepID=UPI003EB6C1AD
SIKSSNPVIAQKEKKITGTVVDVTGIPVVGANVMVKGTTNGTVTDIDGKFSLSAEKGDIFEVSYIGYLPCERKIGNESTLAIILK